VGSRTPETQSDEAVKARIRRVLGLAKRGRTAGQLARELGRFQSRGGETRNSYYHWSDEPESLSAPALAAAIELAGPEGVAALIGADGLKKLLDRYCVDGNRPVEPGAPGADTAALQRRVAQLEEDFAKLRRGQSS
jgi:hypothetical protein